MALTADPEVVPAEPDALTLLGRCLVEAVSRGALLGLAYGALVGSLILPIVGTVVGAVLGVGIGALVGVPTAGLTWGAALCSRGASMEVRRVVLAAVAGGSVLLVYLVSLIAGEPSYWLPIVIVALVINPALIAAVAAYRYAPRVLRGIDVPRAVNPSYDARLAVWAGVLGATAVLLIATASLSLR